MSFSQATITAVTIHRDQSELFVSWSSSAAEGAVFQVYVDEALAWEGTERFTWLPTAPDGVRIDVGTISPGDQGTVFAGSLASIARPHRASLSWYGGTYEADDIEGYHVYGEATPGGGVSYAVALATLPAYDTDPPADGWGVGKWGRGGWGRAASEYAWTSSPLTGGTWTFAVKPYDVAGNEGGGSTCAVVIAAPPKPPSPFSDGTRLHYTYDVATHKATLIWNASP